MATTGDDGERIARVVILTWLDLRRRGRIWRIDEVVSSKDLEERFGKLRITYVTQAMRLRQDPNYAPFSANVSGLKFG